jgi:hypothetical protein
MVIETLVFFSPFNQLTRLVAREYFIIKSLHESYKSYINIRESVAKLRPFHNTLHPSEARN